MNFGDIAQFHYRSFAKATFNLGKRLLDRLFTLACGSRHDCTASIHHRLILLTHWLSQLQGFGYRDCAVPLPCVPPYFYAANPLKGRGISHRLVVARNTGCVVRYHGGTKFPSTYSPAESRKRKQASLHACTCTM